MHVAELPTPGRRRVTPRLVGQITLTNARVTAAALRRLADEAEGEQRRVLRDLTVRASELARDLERALS